MGQAGLSAKRRGTAVAKLIVLTLVYALFGNALLEGKASIPAGVESKQTVQERILEVPLGTRLNHWRRCGCSHRCRRPARLSNCLPGQENGQPHSSRAFHASKSESPVLSFFTIFTIW